MPKRYVLVVGTFALSVLLYVDRICISAAKDPIARDLSLTDKQFGWRATGGLRDSLSDSPKRRYPTNTSVGIRRGLRPRDD